MSTFMVTQNRDLRSRTELLAKSANAARPLFNCSKRQPRNL